MKSIVQGVIYTVTNVPDSVDDIVQSVHRQRGIRASLRLSVVIVIIVPVTMPVAVFVAIVVGVCAVDDLRNRVFFRCHNGVCQAGTGKTGDVETDSKIKHQVPRMGGASDRTRERA